MLFDHEFPCMIDMSMVFFFFFWFLDEFLGCLSSYVSLSRCLE
jgi:hypothetical protein